MRHFPSPDIGMFGRRQRYARGHRAPVVIIGRADAVPSDVGTIVISDTFGAEDTAPIGPCACCTVRVALQGALRALAAQRERQHFSRVVIRSEEELGPILRTFANERALEPLFHVEDHPPLASCDGDVRRFTLSEKAPLDWTTFSRFVTTLTALRGPDLLQVKGMLNVDGCRGPVAVQLLQHLAHRPIELQTWPDDDQTSRLAFTTRGIEESAVRELFNAVRVAASRAQAKYAPPFTWMVCPVT